MVNAAAWFDTDLFAPRQRTAMEADAITRTGVCFIDVRGARLRVRMQAGPQPTIIVLPDGPNIIEHHDRVFKLFEGRNAVLAIDMPGFGFFWANRADTLSFEGAVAAILQVVD